MSEKILSCADLGELCEGHTWPVAVLVLADPDKDKVQIVTYGKSANHKILSHVIKTWIREDLDLRKAETVTHESFILEAAINRERLDRCIKALHEVLQTYSDTPPVTLSPHKQHLCIDAYQFATGTGKYKESQS